MSEAPFKPGDTIEWKSFRTPPEMSFSPTGMPGIWVRNGARFKVLAYGIGSALGDLDYRRDSVWVEDPRATQFALELPASGFVLVTNPENLKHECPICHYCCASDELYKEHMYVRGHHVIG